MVFEGIDVNSGKPLDENGDFKIDDKIIYKTHPLKKNNGVTEDLIKTANLIYLNKDQSKQQKIDEFFNESDFGAKVLRDLPFNKDDYLDLRRKIYDIENDISISLGHINLLWLRLKEYIEQYKDDIDELELDSLENNRVHIKDMLEWIKEKINRLSSFVDGKNG